MPHIVCRSGALVAFGLMWPAIAGARQIAKPDAPTEESAPAAEAAPPPSESSPAMRPAPAEPSPSKAESAETSAPPPAADPAPESPPAYKPIYTEASTSKGKNGKPLYMFEPDQDYPRRFVDRPFTVARNMSQVSLRFDWREGDEQFNDAGDFIKTPDERRNMAFTLEGQYGYTYYFNLLIRLPFLMKSVEDVDGPNRGDTFTGNGIGDAEIEGIYQLQNTGRFFVAGILGVKLPGSENTNTEGAGLTTGSGTLDFYFKAPFKKAWRHWSLGGLFGYRFFGQDDLSDFKYGNRLDIQGNATVQFTDWAALQADLVFFTQGSSGLSGVAEAGEASSEESFYGVGPRLLLNPASRFDVTVGWLFPLRGINTDKYSTYLGADLAFRF